MSINLTRAHFYVNWRAHLATLNIQSKIEMAALTAAPLHFAIYAITIDEKRKLNDPRCQLSDGNIHWFWFLANESMQIAQKIKFSISDIFKRFSNILNCFIANLIKKTPTENEKSFLQIYFEAQLLWNFVQ